MSVIIRLQNLPLSAGASDVRAFFSGLKIPDGAVHIIGGAEGDAFIGFASDEDARQAMRKDRGTIHQTEVRLLLSSRSEMTSIIEHVKNGGAPKSESIESQQQFRQKTESSWNNEPTYPVYKPNQHAPSEFSDQNQPVYGRNTFPKADIPDGYYHPSDADYSSSFNKPAFPQRDPEPAASNGRWPPPITNRFSNGVPPPAQAAAPEERKPAVPSQKSIEELLAALPPHLRPPHGVPPPHLQHLFPKPASSNSDRDRDNRADIQKQSAPATSSREESWRSTGNSFGNDTNQRREPEFPRSNAFVPTPTPAVPAAAPFQPFNDSAMKALLQNVIAQKGTAFSAAPMTSTALPMPTTMPFLPGVLPFAPPGTSLQAERYVELTRVPEKLQRPAPLEDFIRPIKSLSLSSVKMIFTSRGVHVSTIIRFDNPIDAENLLKRDGEQGIRIRTAAKIDFDKADERSDERDRRRPSPRRNGVDRRDDRRDNRDSRDNDRNGRNRDGGRGGDRGADRGADRGRDRRPERDGGRPGGLDRDKATRSPLRKRQRRSPPPARQSSNSTRWCVQLTNVPFKVKEDVVTKLLSEVVKPARVTRTYYDDGNASDRWVAEFKTEKELEQILDMKPEMEGRTIRIRFISNERADEIIAIEDKYGEVKKKMNEEIAAKNGNGAPPQTVPVEPLKSLTGLFGRPNNGAQNRFNPIGGNFPPQGPPPMNMMRGGMMAGRGFPPRGNFRGAMRGGRGGFRGGMMPPNNVNEEFLALIRGLGKPGAVVVCSGFPTAVTLDDVMKFFEGYFPLVQSVRMKTDDKQVMTGECLLACEEPEFAQNALRDLNGKMYQGRKISVMPALPS